MLDLEHFHDQVKKVVLFNIQRKCYNVYQKEALKIRTFRHSLCATYMLFLVRFAKNTGSAFNLVLH